MSDFLPFDHDVECHDTALDSLILEGSLTRDFGPWKKNEKVCFVFNFEIGTVTEYDEEGKERKKKKLTLVCDE